MWATSQGYGSSFDNLFALAEPAGLRFGVPQVGSSPLFGSIKSCWDSGTGPDQRGRGEVTGVGKARDVGT